MESGTTERTEPPNPPGHSGGRRKGTRAAGGAGRRGRASRLITVVGVLLILSGVGVLGYVAWEFWGTTWVSKRKQAEIVKTLEKNWDTGTGSTLKKAGSTADAIIRIPRFGADYAVPVLRGTSDAVLSSGFGHFEDSAGPGQVGNYALAGHRITHGEPLRRMPELQVGDEVVVETAKRIFTYELTTGGDDLVVPFTQGWVVDALPTNPEKGGVQPTQRPGQKLITLTTCAELFHTDDRMIAFGVLTSSSKR